MSQHPRVYFYCRDEWGNLQEDVITLAEGFRELGVAFSGNCNYWLQSENLNDYLIKYDPEITHDECDIVVVSYTWPQWIHMRTYEVIKRPLPERLFTIGRGYKVVYMDSHDGHRTISWEPEYRQFDIIFRSKLNQRSWHPENMTPWVLGYTNRIWQATSNAKPFAERKRQILVNFGASHPYPHGTRLYAERYFEHEINRVLEIERTKDDLSIEPADKYDALMWRQTGYRFSRSYYERLKDSQAVACFCGELIPPMPFKNPECYLVGGNKARLRKVFYELLGRIDWRTKRSVQWDSFRFWESLTAGCTAFNIDLGLYGVEIPVMPVNWQHYIGINFDNVRESIDRILDEPAVLERIANQGREWVKLHYSPAAMAKRFLSTLGYEV